MQIGHECDLGCDQECPLHAPYGQQTSTYHHRSSGYQWQEYKKYIKNVNETET